jgi:hypothetical protein
VPLLQDKNARKIKALPNESFNSGNIQNEKSSFTKETPKKVKSTNVLMRLMEPLKLLTVHSKALGIKVSRNQSLTLADVPLKPPENIFEPVPDAVSENGLIKSFRNSSKSLNTKSPKMHRKKGDPMAISLKDLSKSYKFKKGVTMDAKKISSEYLSMDISLEPPESGDTEQVLSLPMLKCNSGHLNPIRTPSTKAGPMQPSIMEPLASSEEEPQKKWRQFLSSPMRKCNSGVQLPLRKCDVTDLNLTRKTTTKAGPMQPSSITPCKSPGVNDIVVFARDSSELSPFGRRSSMLITTPQTPQGLSKNITQDSNRLSMNSYRLNPFIGLVKIVTAETPNPTPNPRNSFQFTPGFVGKAKSGNKNRMSSMGDKITIQEAETVILNSFSVNGVEGEKLLLNNIDPEIVNGFQIDNGNLRDSSLSKPKNIAFSESPIDVNIQTIFVSLGVTDHNPTADSFAHSKKPQEILNQEIFSTDSRLNYNKKDSEMIGLLYNSTIENSLATASNYKDTTSPTIETAETRQTCPVGSLVKFETLSTDKLDCLQNQQCPILKQDQPLSEESTPTSETKDDILKNHHGQFKEAKVNTRISSIFSLQLASNTTIRDCGAFIIDKNILTKKKKSKPMSISIPMLSAADQQNDSEEIPKTVISKCNSAFSENKINNPFEIGSNSSIGNVFYEDQFLISYKTAESSLVFNFRM